MKSILVRFARGRLLLACLVLAAISAPLARAGLTLELSIVRYNYGDNYYYYFSPSLSTNTTAPLTSFGDYAVASSGAPGNGSHAEYRCDATGFNFSGGGNWGYGDFPSFMYQLTNANWSVAITNATTTNVYYFTVTASITSNSLPNVVVTFPTNGAVNITNQPTFSWQGPTNYSVLVAYEYNASSYLPVTQTNWPSPRVLYQGINGFTAHYDKYLTNATSVPQATNLNSLAGWLSTAHLQTYFNSQFTVGTVDTSGTSHTLVARYAWDGTNMDGSASGVDGSGHGYDMNFGGGQGGQGSVNSTTNALAGPRAIQFHDGDGNSAGYVGWNPTPSNLLSTLAGSFTISCWIKTTQNNLGWDDAPAFNGAGIVSADNDGLANDVIPIALTGSKIGFNTGGDVEDVTLNSTAAVNDGSYHHIVVTRNQLTGQKIIYIDGSFDSFSSGTTNRLDSPQLLTIGALSDASISDASSTSYYNGFNGELDDLQIYSGALSAGEVTNLYANPGSTAANGGGSGSGHTNIAHYTFDTANTNTFDLGLDSSTRVNSLSGYSYWGQVHTNTTLAVAGGRAVEFFGTSSMNANNQVLTNLNEVLKGSFTFSAWVKTTASRGSDSDDAISGATLFWAYNDHNNTNDTIPLAITGSKAAFTTRDHLGNFNTLHSTTSVNDGSYHLITVTRSQASGEKRIYVDGNFEASEIGTTEPLNGNDYYLTVGGSVYSSYTGRMDDFQIYSGVLSATEIAGLYTSPGTTIPDLGGATNTAYPVDVDLQFYISWAHDGANAYYDATVSFNSVSPHATTTNRVSSPNGYFHAEQYPSSGGSGSTEFSSLAGVIDECTNGFWKLYINEGSPTQQVYSFKASITGLDTNLLKTVTVFSPTNGAVNVATNPVFRWTGPSNFSTLVVDLLSGPAIFPSVGTTNWPSAPTLNYGPDRFDVGYASNNFPGMTFTTPVEDTTSTPVQTWSTTVNLSSTAFTFFTVGAPAPLPVQLLNLQSTNASFRFSFQTLGGRPHTVQSRTNLASGTWIDLTNFTGDGSLKQFIFPTTNPPVRFFRVRTQ